MKSLNILSALLIMGSMAFAAPTPKEMKKMEKEHRKAAARAQSTHHKDHEKTESVKEAKLAKKVTRQNNMRYRNEARERRDFNNPNRNRI